MRVLITTLLMMTSGLLSVLAGVMTDDFVPEDGMTIGDNYIAFEAEATSSPLGLWEIIRPGDARYQTSAYYPPINNTHLEFTGNDKNGGTATSPLEYSFRCPKTGIYRLGARLYQRLEGEPDDKCNDVYIKLAGDFTTGNSISTSDLQHDQKFFGRGVDTWGALYSLEIHSTGYKGPAVYQLKEGEIYTLTVSGRAQRTNIDYWLLYETSLPITLQGHKDLMGVNAPQFRPTIYTCKTFSAVDMKFTGIDGFTDAQTDKKAGMSILQIPARLQWAAAQMVFQGTDGEAAFTLNTLQETDGESTYRVSINGERIGEVTNDRIHGITIPDYTVQSHLINTIKAPLNNGDTVQVEFQNATNGLVPEGDLTATARGRWLSLDICTSGSFAHYYFTLSSDSISLQAQDSVALSLEKLLPYNVNPTIQWESSDVTIATVDSTGMIRALKGGTTVITAKTTNGEYTATCPLMVYNTIPFAEAPMVIPGVIEAENFDYGGEGKAYHDLLPYNAGNVYRQVENVDIEACDDGGYNLRSTQAGEWLVYTVDVQETGIYAFYTSVASDTDNQHFSIAMDDEPLIESVNFSSTGGLNVFKTIIVEDVALTKGRHVVKLSFETEGVHMSWMGFFLPNTEFKVTDIQISSKTFRLDADESKTLSAVVLPVVALDKSLTWSSDDVNVARVDSMGEVTGVNQGKTYIKASSSDGLISDSVEVQVFGYSGIEAVQERVFIYPNPSTSGLFYLERAVPWQVYDISGLNVVEGSDAFVNLSALEKGFYILKTEKGTQMLLFQ